MNKLIPILNDDDFKKTVLMVDLAQKFNVKTNNGTAVMRTAPVQNHTVVNYIGLCSSPMFTDAGYLKPDSELDPDAKLKSLYLIFGNHYEYDTDKVLRFDVSNLQNNVFIEDGTGNSVQHKTLHLAIRIGSVTTSGDPLFEDKDNIPGLDDSKILFILEVKSNIICDCRTGWVSAEFEIEPSYEPFRLALEEKYGGRLFVGGYDIEVNARH